MRCVLYSVLAPHIIHKNIWILPSLTAVKFHFVKLTNSLNLSVSRFPYLYVRGYLENQMQLHLQKCSKTFRAPIFKECNNHMRYQSEFVGGIISFIFSHLFITVCLKIRIFVQKLKVLYMTESVS